MISVCLPALLAAAEDGGQTAAWTKPALGARSASLGRAVSALSKDLGAAQVNPAQLASFKAQVLGSQLAFFPDGRQWHYLGFARPVEQGSPWAWGLSLSKFGWSTLLERRTGNSAEPDSSFDDSAWGLGLGLAGSLWKEGPSLGATVKGMWQALAGGSVTGYSLDLGAAGTAASWMDWGLALRDAVSTYAWSTGKNEALPRQARLGSVWHKPGLPLDVLAEGVWRETQALGWALGLEGRLWSERLSLRAGLEDGAWRLGFGGGFEIETLKGRLDYALGADPTSDALFQHRFSLDLELPL